MLFHDSVSRLLQSCQRAFAPSSRASMHSAGLFGEFERRRELSLMFQQK